MVALSKSLWTGELKASIERRNAAWTDEQAHARSNVEKAQAAIDNPSKPVTELSRKEMLRIARECGLTKQNISRARQLAKMSAEEFEEWLARRRRPGRAKPVAA